MTWEAARGLSFDAAGDLLIADSGNEAVRRLSGSGQVTVASLTRDFRPIDGPGPFGTGFYVSDVAGDVGGNIYLTDPSHHLIRKVDAQGNVSNFAGQVEVCGDADGQGASATLCYPDSIALDPGGNLYVSQRRQAGGSELGNSIRKITPAGVVTTFALQVSRYRSVIDLGIGRLEYFRPSLLAADSKGVLYAGNSVSAAIQRTPAGRQPLTHRCSDRIDGRCLRRLWRLGRQRHACAAAQPAGRAQSPHANANPNRATR